VKSPIWKRRWFVIAAVALVALIVAAALSGGEDDTVDEADSTNAEDGDATDIASNDLNSENDDLVDDDDGATSTSTTSLTPAIEGGTRDQPFAYGNSVAVELDSFGDADGSVWNVTIGELRDITGAVLAENQFNDPPPDDVVFSGFTVEMTLIQASKQPLSPGFNFSWEILGGSSSVVHDEFGFDGCGVSPDDFRGFAETFVAGTLTGLVCVPIPTEDLADAGTQVAIHHSGDTRTIFGIDGVVGQPIPVPDGFPGAPSVTNDGGGTRTEPFAYGDTVSVELDSFGDADGSIWDVTIGAPADITAAILGENQFNDPPRDGLVFAGFTVEVTLVEASKEPLAPGFNLSWEILGGASSLVHDEFGFNGCGVAPNEFDGFNEVLIGGTLTGTVCVPIPADDLGHAATQVAIHHSGDSRTIFAP